MCEFRVPYDPLVGVLDDLADCGGSCCTGGDGASCFLDAGGLCCPDDPLDTVIQNLAAAADGFLESLGIEAGPPLPTGSGGAAPPPLVSESVLPGVEDAGMAQGERGVCGLLPVDMVLKNGMGWGGGGPRSCDGDKAAVFAAQNVTVLPAHNATMLTAHDAAMMAAHDATVFPPHAAPVFPAHAPPVLPAHAPPVFPAHATRVLEAHNAAVLAAQNSTMLAAHAATVSPADAALSDSSAPTSTVSSGCQSSTAWETASRAPALQLQLDLAVPRKKRNRPAASRRNQSWSPNFLLGAAVQAAPHDNLARANDSGNGASKHSCGSNVGGAGAIRQRPVARPRNRQSARVCTHCGSWKTPQWRAGPEGPGTLCNACGIRHTMGKLLNEYRPLTSPSFQSDKHSNRHRKAVKLLEKKAKEEALKLRADATVLVANTTVPMAGICQ